MRSERRRTHATPTSKGNARSSGLLYGVFLSVPLPFFNLIKERSSSCVRFLLEKWVVGMEVQVFNDREGKLCAAMPLSGLL